MADIKTVKKARRGYMVAKKRHDLAVRKKKQLTQKAKILRAQIKQQQEGRSAAGTSFQRRVRGISNPKRMREAAENREDRFINKILLRAEETLDEDSKKKVKKQKMSKGKMMAKKKIRDPNPYKKPDMEDTTGRAG